MARFLLLPALLVTQISGFLTGGAWLWIGIAVYLFLFMVADNFIGEQVNVPEPGSEIFFNIMLYSTAPLIVINTILFGYYLSSSDLLSLEPLVGKFLGIELADGRAATNGVQLLGGIVSMATLYTSVGGIVGHELMHRLNRPADLVLSRILLAFNLDTTFAIEHVFGHHRHACTPVDPTWADRGMGFWRYLPRSVFGGAVNAYKFEAARVNACKFPARIFHNRALVWQSASLIIIFFFFFSGGWWAVLAFLAAAVLTKIFLEMFNYIAHYGLVRVPGHRFSVRHSWNSYRLLATGYLFNLPRHSSHHLNVRQTFWELKARPDAPRLPYSMGAMLALCLIPPLWHRAMRRSLSDWDREFASPEELKLLAGRT